MSALYYCYEADTHCPACAARRFGPEREGTDGEGNPVRCGFAWDDGPMDEHNRRLPIVCGTCLGIVREGEETEEQDQ